MDYHQSLIIIINPENKRHLEKQILVEIGKFYLDISIEIICNW